MIPEHLQVFKSRLPPGFLFLVKLNRMKLLFRFALLLLVSGNLQAQDPKFPADMLGRWKGELSWYQTGTAEPRQVVMELRIEKADTAGWFTWQILYGAAGEDDRPYTLKPVDEAKGHWVIDENNGILLDMYWVAGRFTGAFSVGKSTILESCRREGDKLVVEFYSTGVQPVRTTGDGTEESPKVDSYRVGSYQQAILSRIN